LQVIERFGTTVVVVDVVVDVVVVTAEVTVMETVAVADRVPSVAVTVYVVAADDAVGVPEMTPVEAFMVSPLGNAGDTENVLVLSSVSVYAAVGVIALPTTPLIV
jgi:hypothetical protein